MSIKAITEAIHEYMYEKLNESLETEGEKKIRHVEKMKLVKNKEQTERHPKTRRLDCNKCEAPNWSKYYECPTRGKKCIKCGKLGHYAKCYRSTRKINHIADEEADSADEDDWRPDEILSIRKKKNSMGAKSKKGISFYARTLFVNNRPIKFIIDTDSPVALIPKTKFNRITTIRPVSENYRDVNDNKIKFEGKTLENIEIDGKSKQLELLITTKQTHLLLNLNWMKELGITLKTETPHQSTNNLNQPDQSNKESDADIETLKSKFHKLFTENHRVNNIEVDIQLDFIGPITEKNHRFHILLSMDRFSKWPATSFCKSTESQTAVKFLEQHINLNGKPKTIRTDKATAFTNRLVRDFSKNHQIQLIYGTPFIHKSTGLVERGVRTLKETLLTNIKAGENFGKALDIALDVMRKTPYTRLNKSPFELHYGHEPNTKISNLLNFEGLKKLTRTCISAKPDTLQVYSFNGAGCASDQQPMKLKKGAKGVSNLSRK